MPGGMVKASLYHSATEDSLSSCIPPSLLYRLYKLFYYFQKLFVFAKKKHSTLAILNEMKLINLQYILFSISQPPASNN